MVKINGEALAVAGKTLAEYLAGTDYNPKRIAVERNGEIVPKAAYGGAHGVVAVAALRFSARPYYSPSGLMFL